MRFLAFTAPPPSPELLSEIATILPVVRQGEGLLIPAGTRVHVRQPRCVGGYDEMPSRSVDEFSGVVLRPTCSDMGYWITDDSGQPRLAFADEVTVSRTNRKPQP